MTRLEHIREILEGHTTLPASKERGQLDSAMMKATPLTPLCRWDCLDMGWCLVLPPELASEVQSSEPLCGHEETAENTEPTVHVLERQVASRTWTFLDRTQRDAEWIRIWLEIQEQRGEPAEPVAAPIPERKAKPAAKPKRTKAAHSKKAANVVSEHALYGGMTKVREDFPAEGIHPAIVEDVIEVGWRKRPSGEAATTPCNSYFWWRTKTAKASGECAPTMTCARNCTRQSKLSCENT